MNAISGSLFRLRGLSLSGVCLWLVLTAATVFQSHAQTTPEVVTLEPGRGIERDLAGLQEHAFSVALAEGQFAKVEVQQSGVDVRVQLLGADGKPAIDVDGDMRTDRSEVIEFVAPNGGGYRLLVKGKYQNLPAGRYEIRLTEVRPATDNDRSLDEARRLQTLAWQLRMSDKYTEGLPLAQKALQLQEKVLGAEHGDLAYTLFILAVTCEFKVDYANAESYYQRAQAVAEKALGPEHPLLARIVSSSGYHYFRHRGDYSRAEGLYLRGLSIREKALGPEHPEVAKSVKDLGFLSSDIGDYVRAESYLQRAVAINQKAFGDEHVEVALSLSYLAAVYMNRGDHSQAEPLFQRALSYFERSFGAESGWAAIGLKNLALYYTSVAEYDRAEPLLLKAISIDSKGNPPDHPAILGARHNLTEVYYRRGDISKAESVSNGLLPTLERVLGPNHIMVGLHLHVLARISLARNDHANARSLSRRAMTALEGAAGPNHHVIAEALLDLAAISSAEGKPAEAVVLQKRAQQIIEYNLNINLAVGSERQKLAYLAVLPEHLDRAVSLQARFASDDRSALELAAASVLQRKGRVHDALSHSVSALRDRLNEEDRALLDRLNVISSQLSRLVLDGPEGVTPAEHQKRIKGLEEQREKLENEVSRRSAGFYRPSQSISLSAVQAAIPNGTALIEFALYRPFDAKAPAATAYGEPRYVVYVLNGRGEIGWKSLGEAKAINDAVARLRQAVRDPMRKDVGRLARALDRKLMQPVRSLAGDAGRLIISPDGELNLVPFEVLVDEKGRNLIENYSITYLATGRDLVRMQSARESKSETAVIADPVFGEPDPQQLFASASSAKTAVAPKRRSITNTRNLSETYFAPLSGTALEAKSIKMQFPEARLVTGPAATETAVKELSAPRVLHIATHGFFLDDGDPGSTRPAVSRSILGTLKVENPLMRSGLAFTGANVRSGIEDDGILTALEASGLDLWGTKLVVLSACDTGVGEIRNGEGVFGLRRSFALAGAESLVMSLWPVSDQVTRELMTNYYQNLKQGLGRGEALRQVQIEMAKRPARRHPFYWASFILSGEWANLDGKR